ncbi:MAG TPA: 50S ribosomal protein L11 methyltransferase [Candidatus Anaerotruncus excrementipullorum]|uniref:Ribosomal protein L11 methyltransferase n=1 Tax=Candidatus Anaerotruncus excrementipullorum TaxID=2838465 RepID=A0A9D2B804_9FIRM|nr:50S ribosomal protein L11 methyltransferase [Candidatus Anaerotruncus excrementipullorum]
MQYNEIKIKVATRDAQTAEAIANLVVPYGIYIEDYSDIEELAPQIAHVDLIEQELLERDRDHAVIHLYIPAQENPLEAISFLRARLDAAGIAHAIRWEKVEEEDWATAWKQFYHPTHIGSRLVVCPSWEPYAPQPQEVVLTLDPGMAFGTGTHETTRLCLELLEQVVTPGTSLLDVGTGSGILAVAALLLGARSAVGVDIDEVAVRVATENAQQNGVAGRAAFLAGDLTQKVEGTYQVVTANIVADVILRLLPDLGRFLQPGGDFIASGIIDTREQELVEAVAAAGYRIVEVRRLGGWVAIHARRA